MLGVEIEVKHVLEGHEKGVNWASFHPTRNLICSGADDKTIKLWRMSGARAWEMDTLRGHNNNVSCAKFHQTQEILFSNSEDKSFKVWDLNRRICIDTIKKENERYWIIATHPSQAYFATGHDKGMSIYKLERERYEACRDGNSLYFVKNKVFTSYDIHSKE